VLRRLVDSKLLSMPVDKYQEIIPTMPQALVYEVLMGMKRHISDLVPDQHKPVLGSPTRLYVQDHAAPIALD